MKIWVAILLVCSGCDIAAKQQEAEQARAEATAASLKQTGEALHAGGNGELSVDGEPKDSP